ncbi:MAG: phosphoserine transaminase [Alphaproteobacteria bacterium]|nr:phosphoserine transaminase [Alphaproteobacteria bacterium]
MNDISAAPAARPDIRPANPNFSSGPCSKRPGWSPEVLRNAVLGRSHRANPAKQRIEHAIGLTRRLLEVPDDYAIAIVPGSDTGAMEMALWSLLGPRGVDVLAWESFGAGWVTDIVKQLKLGDVRTLCADYGALPDLGTVDWSRDVVFAWNGTTSGVRVPDGDWIDENRSGLAICDATSAVFSQDVPLEKLDVITFSWQKALGGEAAHGVIILSPMAIERLENHTPAWPMPKLFRLTKGGRFNRSIFEGATINTPSMLVIEDAIDAMEWGISIGGLKAMQGRSEANFTVLKDWVSRTAWVGFLARDPATASNSSVCLSIVDHTVLALDGAGQAAFAKRLAGRLAAEHAAYDIGAYRDAPPGLRIWCGATIEAGDVTALVGWLDWAFEAGLNEL